MKARLLAGIIACLVVAIPATPAVARDDVVRSFDGTPIVLSFYPARGPAAGEPAPTVMVGHGWGGERYGDDDQASGASESLGPQQLLRAGYNVLTWDARGFGESGGTVHVDSPDWEARDVSRLVGYVARRHAALLDGPRDPRIGMAGGSYGGGIQLTTAASDHRIDAIVPGIAWHSLVPSLDKRHVAKGGWGSLLYGVGIPASLTGGLLGQAGLQAGTLDPQVHEAFANGVVRGELSGADRRFFRTRGPGNDVARIEAPTLLIQGTVDTLFTLQEAVKNYRLLQERGTPVKMLWFCGGHGICSTEDAAPFELPGEQSDYVHDAAMRWFDRYLKGRDVETGPGFGWFADDGELRTAASYTAKPEGALRGRGSGRLALAPGAGAEPGLLIMATPAATQAVEIPIEPVEASANLVVPPRLKLTYSGTAAPADTRVYAQIVDTESGLVLANQVAPVPLMLDGERHSLKVRLEIPAAHAESGDRYTLQLIPGTSVYFPQRAAGVVDFHRVRVRLPVSG